MANSGCFLDKPFKPVTHIIAGAGRPAVLYLSARFEAKEWPHLQAVGGTTGPCEMLQVSVTPGIIATNLLHHPLFVAPASAAAAAQPCMLAPGATQPILAAWRGGSLQDSALLVAMQADLIANALSAAASKADSSAAVCEHTVAAEAPGFADSFVVFLEGAAGSPAGKGAAHAACTDLVGSTKGVGLLHMLSAQGRRSRLLLTEEGGHVRPSSSFSRICHTTCSACYAEAPFDAGEHGHLPGDGSAWAAICCSLPGPAASCCHRQPVWYGR